jgi:hypothetical protein
MTIAFDGTGGLFTRLGRFGDEYLRVVASYGSTLDTAVEDIRDEYETGAQGVVIDNLYASRDAYRGVHAGWLNALQTMMQNNVIEQVNDDTALVSKTLASAIQELIRQMVTNSETVLRGTSSATTTAYGSNKGDAQVLHSFTNQYGDAIATAYPETIKYSCTTDSTNFQEVFTIAGQPTKPVTDRNWPGGSGASGNLTLVNAASNSYLTNGNFDTWTNPSAAPSSWTLTVGTAGSTIIRDTTVKRTSAGGYAMQFAGDSATLHDIKQQLSTTLVGVNQVLCFHAWGKMSAADANAVLRVRLEDSTGTVLSNDAGTNLTASFDCNSTIGTSYTSLSTFFQLPRQLPSSGVFLRLTIITGAIDTGKTLNLSLVGLTQATQTYLGGPFVAGFSAALPHAVGDYFSTAVANDATNASWVRAQQRWLGMPHQLGATYYLPTVTTGETVADSLLA